MTIGIIGGGQLALMMIQESPEFEYFVIDPNPECSVMELATVIVAQYDDKDALQELYDKCDVITYEFENIPSEGLKIIEDKLYPNSNVLYISQNRLREKNLARDLCIPTPLYYSINNIEELKVELNRLGGFGVLKTQEGGYDGKGQIVIRHNQITDEIIKLVENNKCILEELIKFNGETSIIATRDNYGNVAFYQPTDNIHENQILQLTYNLNKISYKQKFKAAKTIMEHLNVIGTLTIEFFITDYGFIFNEIAPRVHNSGHWTIEGSTVSQFRNHILAVAGKEIETPKNKGYTAMLNLIGDQFIKAKKLELPEFATFHDYFKKEVRPGRKMGHITINHEDQSVIREWISKMMKGIL